MDKRYPSVVIFAFLICLIFFKKNVFSLNDITPSFTENKGQLADFDGKIHTEFLFYFNSASLDIYFREKGITYIFKKGNKAPDITGLSKEKQDEVLKAFLNEKTLYYRLDMNFKDSNEKIGIKRINKSESLSNYYYPHCPNGILNISSFEKIKYSNVYNGIDFEFYFNGGKLKYDIILQPNASINQIQLEYNGAKNMFLNNNEITIKSPVGNITETLPESFSIERSGEKIVTTVFYRLKNNIIQFVNTNKTNNILIIDPQISWTTYYDGLRFLKNASSIDVKSSQCVISSSSTSILFPTLNPGGSTYFQNAKAGTSDYLIMQFNTNGVLQWSTYYGGTGGDYNSRVKIDYQGNIIIIGETTSTNIPTQNAGGYFDNTYNSNYVYYGSFIMKFNSAGTRLWATHYDYISTHDLDIDLNNNIYVLAQTTAGDSTLVSKPSVQNLAGAYNQSNPSNTAPTSGVVITLSEDLYIIKFSPSTARIWATNFGSTCEETPLDIHCGNDNYINILAIGDNYYGVGIVSQNAGGYYDNTLGIGIGGSSLDRWDALVYRFNPSCALVWGTAFSGTKNDNVIGYNNYVGNITTDINNNIYILGQTEGASLPFINPGGGAYFDNTFNGLSSDPYIARFNSATQLTWCTYFGEEGINWQNDNSFIGFNNNNNLILITTENSTTAKFPLVPRSGDYNATKTSQTSIYIAEFNNSLNIAWSTYFSGPVAGHGLGNATLHQNSCGYEIYMLSNWNKSSAVHIDPPWVNPGGGAYQDTTYNLVSGQSGSGLITKFSKLAADSSSINASFCIGGSYTLPSGTVVSNPGIYIDTLTASGGCDSIITITLTSANSISDSVASSICSGNNYTLPDGSIVSAAGTYLDTLTALGGCDSIITTFLTVNPTSTISVNANICSGNTYTLPGGNNVNTAGIYTDTLSTAGGCDSIITTTLSVNPNIAINISASICAGDNYTLPDGSITSSAGIYKDTLTAIGGCDSIITTTLSLTNSPTITINNSMCNGNTYTLPNGNIVSAAGTYKDTLTTVGGCDSIIITNLTVIQNSFTIINQSICAGSSYTLPDGTLVNTSGVYKDTITNSKGCDSIITINLTVNAAASVNVSSNVTINLGASTTLIANGFGTYNWVPSSGLNSDSSSSVIATPQNTTTYCVILTNTNGCKDTACVTVTVENSCPDSKNLDVPNAFSPNGDNINEEYCLQGWTNCIKDFTITIYDRWGEKVFETKDPGFCWNGFYNKKVMDAQVLVYFINAKHIVTGESIKKTGNISLLR